MRFIHLIYFSATGNTKKVCQQVGETMSKELGYELKHYDFTLPKNRAKGFPKIAKNDVIIVGVPTYAGRVPNLILPFLCKLNTNGAKGVALVTYGNRAYDDALIELCDTLIAAKSNLVGAAAFVGEHSFSRIIATGRPNCDDLKMAEHFAHTIVHRCTSDTQDWNIEIEGAPYPYRGFYKPKFVDGTDNDIRKAKPITTDACNDCGLCVDLCPLGSIQKENVREVSGVCMKCCACVKQCPNNAKTLIDKGFIYHKMELEEEFS